MKGGRKRQRRRLMGDKRTCRGVTLQRNRNISVYTNP